MTIAVNEIDSRPLHVRVIDLLEQQGTVMTITEIVNVIQHSSNPLTVDKPNTSIGKTLSDAMRCDKPRFEPRLSSPGRSHYIFLDEPEETHSCYACNGGIKKTSTGDAVIGVLNDIAIDSIETDYDKPDFHCQAYGLRWQKSLIVWGNQSSGILGDAAGDGVFMPVDCAPQAGIYVLYNGPNIAYVGRTVDSLGQRLRSHSKDHKSARWDNFSWFGFKPMLEDGKWGDLPENADVGHIIACMEGIMIEAMEPPVNGRRGDYMGTQYTQVPDPIIDEEQRKKVLDDIASVLKNGGLR